MQKSISSKTTAASSLGLFCSQNIVKRPAASRGLASFKNVTVLQTQPIVLYYRYTNQNAVQLNINILYYEFTTITMINFIRVYKYDII